MERNKKQVKHVNVIILFFIPLQMSKQLLDTASKHPFSIAGLADSAWNRVTETVFNTGWSPLARLAEAAVVSYVQKSQSGPSRMPADIDRHDRLMQRITKGHLRVLTFEHIYNFPAVSNDCNTALDLKSELRVINNVFWIRLCAMGDLGFAEAYMYGDVECDDLVSLFQVRGIHKPNTPFIYIYVS